MGRQCKPPFKVGKKVPAYVANDSLQGMYFDVAADTQLCGSNINLALVYFRFTKVEINTSSSLPFSFLQISTLPWKLNAGPPETRGQRAERSQEMSQPL